jgi:POT family proton-dependent oligopeptide transporter
MTPTRDEGVAEHAPETPPLTNHTAPTGGPMAAPTNHPIGFWFFFWGELAERSSYYGMRGILALYMANRLGFTEANADLAMHAFIAACYLLPLLGGWIADNYFGKYWTIVGFSIPYILGHVILGIESIPFLVGALTLLAMGSGVIKPNISTLMGLTYDHERPGQDKLRSDAFAMFYGAINVGAAISSFAMPWIRSTYGYQIAFLFPAGLMVVAFFVFAMGKRHYAVETIGRRDKTAEERHEQWAVFWKIAGVFAVVTFFWSIFDQSASTWTFFAKEHLNLTLFGVTLEPDMIQGLNPVLIVIMLPPVTLFWHFLSNRGIKLRPTDKMLIGYFLAIVTMAMMATAGFLSPKKQEAQKDATVAEASDSDSSRPAAISDATASAGKSLSDESQQHKPSVLWEMAAYVVITLAEICISVVGLELAFTAAPKSMKSFITACWLLTVFAGNLLAMAVTQLYSLMPPGPYFSLLTLMMVAVTAMFVFVANQFNRQVHTT